MQKFTRSFFAVGAVLGLAACGDDVSVTAPTPPPAATVTSVTVSPAQTTIKVNEKVILSANVAVNGSGVSTAVTWSSANAAIASVSAAGEVTGVIAGQTTIRATSTANAGVSGSAAITVSADKGVQSVVVSPTSAILAPTQTLQAVANVTTTSGVAKTVTWASSAAAVATVDATGKITAVAPGAATITATSTVDNTVAGSLALTVRAPAPATISIKSITFGNSFTPVNINNVAGQIETTLNVDPGDQVISKVEILIDNAVVYTQTFSAQQSQDMSLAAVAEAIAEIVGSINTADYDATTGVVKYFNGPRVLSARASVVGGAQVATPSVTLQFNNNSTFVETITLGGTRGTATSSAGLQYERGDVSLSVLPIIYASGRTMAAGTVNFGNPGCDASGTAQRTRSLTAPAGGVGAWTTTFGVVTSGTVAATATVKDYEFNSIACGTTGELATLTATDNAGNQLFAGTSPFNSAAAPAPRVRLDNRAPGAPAFAANPNGRQNGWINATVGLAGSNTSNTDNDWIVNGTADAGVGGYVRLVRAGDGPTVDLAIATAGSSTPTLPAPSTNNNSYCAVISAADLLGNESALPAAGTNCTAAPALPYAGAPTVTTALLFGVDIGAPTIAYNDAAPGPISLGDIGRLNGGSIGGEFVANVADVGTVGVSGMLAGSPVRASVIRRTAAGTVYPADCVVGSYSGVTGLCSPSATGLAVVLPTVSTAITAIAVPGYYTYTATAYDAAGNSTTISATRTVVYDNIAPALTTALFNTPLTGSNVTFNANASDNLDLRDVSYTMTYAGGLPGAATIAYSAVPLNTFNAATLQNSNVAAGISVTDFMRQVENATNVSGTAPLAVGGAFKPITLSGNVRDQAGNTSGPIATNIPGASVATGVSFVKVALDPQEFGSWGVTAPSAATSVSDNAGPAAAINPLSVTLQADAFGRTATFGQPFTRVTFYALSGGNLVRLGDGALQQIFDDGTPFGRRFRWTFSWTPGTAFGLGVQNVYAVGVNANGDALVTLVNGTITVTNP